MAGSSTGQFARLLKRNKPLWPEPEKSIGIEYCKMGRDNSCWEAVGAARETLVEAGTQVKTHLDTDSYPTAETIILSLCMIGRTKETAQPWIMICCKDARCRKRMRRTVEESGIMDKYPTVRVGNCSKQPDIDRLLPLAGETKDPELSDFDTGHGLGISETYVYSDPSQNVFGTQLYLKDSKPNMTSWKKATAGGIVTTDNKYFYMTVAHLFTDEVKITSGDGSDSEFEFDIGQNESEEEENELIETTSRASITPEPDEYASSNSSRIISDALESPLTVSYEELQQYGEEEDAKDEFAFIDDVEKPGALEFVGRLAKLSTDGPHPDLDYALIEIQRPDFPTFNRIQLSETTSIIPWQVAQIKLQNTSIITVTGSSGVLKGILSGTPSFLKSPSSQLFQVVWTVRLDGKLAQGDSGSWVLDSKTGALLGHIVAGSPATGVAYLTPSIQIFIDLRSRFGREFRLPFPTADSIIKSPTTKLILMGPDELVNTEEEVGLLLKESGQRNSRRSRRSRRDSMRKTKAEDLDSDSDDQQNFRPRASGHSKKPQKTTNYGHQRGYSHQKGPVQRDWKRQRRAGITALCNAFWGAASGGTSVTAIDVSSTFERRCEKSLGQ